MLRIVKILLVISVIAWALVGVWTNFAALQRTASAVAAVTSMTTLSTESPLGWRATTSEPVILAGVAFILLFKLATAGLCGIGVWRMWVNRGADAESFARAKSLALARLMHRAPKMAWRM